jgi:hypothetical protein
MNQNLIINATEALKNGYAIRADYTSVNRFLAWIAKNILRLSAYQDRALKTRITADIRHLQFSELQSHGARWIELFTELHNSGRQELARELFNELKGRASTIAEPILFQSAEFSEVEMWMRFLNQLATRFPECKSYAQEAQQRAHRHFVNAQDEKIRVAQMAIPQASVVEAQAAMMLLRNYNPNLLPQAEQPKFSMLLRGWIEFTDSKHLLDCLEMQEHLENSRVREALALLENNAYVPLFLPTKNGTYAQTIVKIESKSDKTVFMDVRTNQTFEADRLLESDWTSILYWNVVCLQSKQLFNSDIPHSLAKALEIPQSKKVTRIQPESDFHKPMRVFYANLSQESKNFLKVQHKMKALERMLENVPRWFENTSMRQWVKGSIANIQKSLQNNPKGKEIAAFQKRCETLIAKIETFESSDRQRRVPSYSNTAPDVKIRLSAGEVQPVPSPLKTAPQSEEFEVSPIDLPKEMPSLIGEKLSREEYFKQGELLQQWVAIAQEAFEKQNFEGLENLCSTFLSSLPSPTAAAPFFDRLNRYRGGVYEKDLQLGELFPIEYVEPESWLPALTDPNQIRAREEEQKAFYKLFECSKFQARYNQQDRITFDKYYFNSNLINTWAIPLFRLGNFALHCQLMKQNLCPKALKGILKLLALQQRLCNIATTHDHHASSPVTLHGLGDVLELVRNYAADLGEHGGEILELIKQFRVPHHERDLIGKTFAPDRYNKVEPVFDCTDQVAACTAYELLSFLNILCNKSFLTSNPREPNDKNYRSESYAALKSLEIGLSKLKRGEMIRVGHRWSSYNSSGYYIYPFNLFFKPIHFTGDFFATHVGTALTSFAHLSAEIKNPKIRTFIQQALLSTNNQLARNSLGVDESYSFRFSSFQREEAFEQVEDVASFTPNTLLGENKTQLVIQREKEWLPGISTECFQELQLMQTSSLTRAENTLYTFTKYPDLLSSQEYGEDFRTVFSLNLFRDAAIYREFQHHPDRIMGHFQKIDFLIEHHKAQPEIFLFLVDVRLKMLKQLTSTTEQNAWDDTLLSTLSLRQEELSTKVHDWWNELSTKKLQWSSRQKGAICRTLLLQHIHHKSTFKTEEELLYLAKLAVTFFASDLIHETADYVQNEILDYLKPYHLMLSLTLDLQGGPHQILQLVLREEEKTKWAQLDAFRWKSGAVTFDLRQFKLRPDHQVEALLPVAIRNHRKLLQLTPRFFLQRKILLEAVLINQVPGWKFTFTSLPYSYEVYFDPKEPEAARIYRYCESQVEQLVEVNFEDKAQELKSIHDLFCWKNIKTNTFRIENSEGREVYRFVDDQLIVVSNDGETYQILSPKKLGVNRVLFEKLCGKEGFELTKSLSGKIYLTYPEYKFRYLWDQAREEWQAEDFPGYILSNQSVETLLRATTTEMGSTPLFMHSFEGYHVLEKLDDPQAPKKVVMAAVQYGGTALGGVQRYQLDSIIGESSWGSTLCTFEIDAEGQLVTQKTHNYLYLAYVLLSQRKYTDALHYLKLGSSVAGYDPARWKTLTDWVIAIPDQTPDAIAAKTRFLLEEQSIRQFRHETMQETLLLDRSLPPLMKLLAQYKQSEKGVSPNLRLDLDPQIVEALELRALPRSEKNEITAPEWGFVSSYAKEFLGREISPEEMVKVATQREIEHSRKHISDIQEIPETQDLFSPSDADVVDLRSYLTTRESKATMGPILMELKELFSGQTYADEIGNTLLEDIEFAAKQHHKCLVPSAKMASLEEKLSQVAEKWRNKERQLKTQLFAAFKLPSLKSFELQQKTLKEQLTTLEEILDQARLCYLNHDWRILLDQKIISDMDYIDDLMGRYLEARVTRKHWSRKTQAVQKYIQEDLHEDKLIEILTSQRGYSVNSSLLSRTLTILEDALDITIREMQLSSFIQQLENPNAFKHAGTGFGKTSLQRHLVLRVKSMQNMLGAGLTHSDLFQTHHQALAETQNKAFNAHVFPFHFKREDRLDDYLLLQFERELLKARLTHRLIDHKKSDILSLKHRFTTQILDKGDFKELQQFQRVRKLHKTGTAVYSDELVTVLNPNQDHTFAYGAAAHLDKTLYTSCLEIFALIQDEADLKPFFLLLRQNKLKHLPEEAFQQWIHKIANKLVMKIPLNCDAGVRINGTVNFDLLSKYLTQDYLTASEEESRRILNYYSELESEITNEDLEKLRCLHRFLEIFKSFRTKIVGVHFGRSKDGITTKPYQKSARPMESSQRSDVPTTIFETCFDYFVNGIAIEKISAYIEAKRAFAHEELEESNDSTLSVGTTKTAEHFLKHFGCSLFDSQFNPEQVKAKIESSGELLSDYLIHVYFKNYTYYPKKIIGNSCHIPNQYLQISGSSGSAERIETLPAAIKREPALARQKGDVGAVFYRLLSNFKDENYIKIDPFKPLAAQIGPVLKKGDVFIDLVPFFPGEKAETIAEGLRQHSSDPTQNMRFVDEEGHLCSLKTEEIDANTTGVLAQSHVEGTDWKFGDGVISHSSDTPFTEFYQAIRMRDLGRGQGAFLASDVNWPEIEKKHPQLKNKSILAKVIYLLVVNDAEMLKKLHYTRLLKEIPAMGQNAFDNLLDTVEDLDSLNQLREFKVALSYLLNENRVQIDSLGAPRKQTAPREHLLKMVEEEKERLQTLLTFIETHKIKCDSAPLKKAIALLENPDQILLSPEKLPESTLQVNLEGIEDLEIETHVDEQQEQQQEMDLAIDFAVEQETDQLQEMLYARKISEEGKEVTFSPFEDPIRALLNLPKGEQMNSFPMQFGSLQPIYVSAHVGGHQTGATMKKNVLEFFWLGGAQEKPALSPKISFVEYQNKRIPLMMSLKDSDLFLQSTTRKLPAVKNADAQEEKDLTFKTYDLRDKGLPDWATEKEKQQIVFAKILYLDAPFSEEELAIAKTLLQGLSLKIQLESYLKTHYPNTWKKLELLKIIQQ